MCGGITALILNLSSEGKYVVYFKPKSLPHEKGSRYSLNNKLWAHSLSGRFVYPDSSIIQPTY